MIKMEKLCSKLELPDDIKDQLEPLHGMCTYKLVENAQQDGNNEGSEFESADSWISIGEKLLALDRFIKVQNDSPEAQKIYKAVLSIPRYITGFLEKEKGIKSEIINIGSFSSGTKIVDVDEFDFLLVSDDEIENEQLWDSFNIQLTPEENNCLQNEKFEENYFTTTPHIKRLYLHGPALCIEIVWKCKPWNHLHTIGVDITPARRNRNKDIKSLLKADYKELFEDHLSISPACFKELSLTVQGMESLAQFDVVIMERISKMIPNALVVLRIVKFFAKYLFPKYFDLVRAPKKGQRLYVGSMCELKDVISSHQLKLIMFNVLRQKPSKNEWEERLINERIADMLKLFHPESLNNGRLEILETCEDHTLVNERQLQEVIKQNKCNEICEIATEVNRFLSERFLLLEGKHDNDHHISSVEKQHYPKGAGFLVSLNNKLHPVFKDVTMKCKIHGITCYSVYCVPDSVLLKTDHPLSNWIQDRLHEKYTENKGVYISNWDEFYILSPMTRLDLGPESELITQFKTMTQRNFSKIDSSNLPEIFCEYSEFYFGIKLYIDKYSIEYHDPFDKINHCFSKLNTREKALIHEIIATKCIKLWDTESSIDRTDKNRDIDQIYKYVLHKGEFTTDIRSILQSVEYANFILARSARSSYQGNDMKADLLTFVCMHYILKEQKGNGGEYFADIDGDIKWAQDVLKSASAYKEENQNPGTIIRIQLGEDNIYRCAMCVENIKYRNAMRISSGEILDPHLYIEERIYIERIKNEHGMSSCTSVKQKLATIGKQLGRNLPIFTKDQLSLLKKGEDFGLLDVCEEQHYDFIVFG